jgi:hypothetical protein
MWEWGMRHGKVSCQRGGEEAKFELRNARKDGAESFEELAGITNIQLVLAIPEVVEKMSRSGFGDH